MPDISSGQYVHDFTVNRTAIVEENRCFVMVMDRSEIAPPRNLFDLLSKTTNDGYEMDLDEIQHEMNSIKGMDSYQRFASLISSISGLIAIIITFLVLSLIYFVWKKIESRRNAKLLKIGEKI